MKIFRFALFALAFLAVLNLDSPAYAYLDPGTGAMVLQALLGGIAGALVFGKVFWGRIKDFFSGSDDTTSSN